MVRTPETGSQVDMEKEYKESVQVDTPPFTVSSKETPELTAGQSCKCQPGAVGARVSVKV